MESIVTLVMMPRKTRSKTLRQAHILYPVHYVRTATSGSFVSNKSEEDALTSQMRGIAQYDGAPIRSAEALAKIYTLISPDLCDIIHLAFAVRRREELLLKDHDVWQAGVS